jgi:hypothetical protein
MGRYTAQINQKRLHSSMRTFSVKKNVCLSNFLSMARAMERPRFPSLVTNPPKKKFRSDRSWFLKRICCVLP